MSDSVRLFNRPFVRHTSGIELVKSTSPTFSVDRYYYYSGKKCVRMLQTCACENADFGWRKSILIDIGSFKLLTASCL